jgi:hypothetical protein
MVLKDEPAESQAKYLMLLPRLFIETGPLSDSSHPMRLNPECENYRKLPVHFRVYNLQIEFSKPIAIAIATPIPMPTPTAII